MENSHGRTKIIEKKIIGALPRKFPATSPQVPRNKSGADICLGAKLGFLEPNLASGKLNFASGKLNFVSGKLTFAPPGS